MTEFIPGLELSELFFKEAVRPILRKHWPVLKYSAALIGCGSEVLGFDTPTSMDHEWGPRVRLFVDEGDHKELAGRINDTIAHELPQAFRGYPTNFAPTSEPNIYRVQRITGSDRRPINHRVEVHTLGSYFRGRHGIDPYKPMTVSDWLTATEQTLLELTRGKVFHDGLSQLNKLRNRLRYYPKDVWLYLLVCQWRRIAQEEDVVGRTGDVGDEVGSKIVAARLVRDVMRLCFLMERQYAPYSKWLGTAFLRLKCAGRFVPIFQKVLSASSWRKRQEHLAGAYEVAARMHNALKITKPLPAKASRFYNRPYLVMYGDRFVNEIRKAIRNKEVRRLAVMGSVDQFSDSTDLTDSPSLCKKLQALFE